MYKPLTNRTRNNQIGHSRQHQSLGNLDMFIDTDVNTVLKPVKTHVRNRSGGAELQNDLKSSSFHPITSSTSITTKNRTLSGLKIKKVGPMKNI